MHLNDAIGHKKEIRVTYNHHEQACAIAAEAYARLDNRIAAVCVTTGPGGTNALTGVVGGWLDSISMFIISGQVRYDTTARYALQYTGTPLRAMGDQEYDIVKSVEHMTKYAVTAKICKKACEIEKSKGLTISCNLNYRNKFWSKEKAREVMSELCQYVDVCIAILENINGIIVGKPASKEKYDVYKNVIKQSVADEAKLPELPILYNVNVGHSYPIGVFPLGLKYEINCEKKTLILLEPATEI